MTETLVTLLLKEIKWIIGYQFKHFSFPVLTLFASQIYACWSRSRKPNYIKEFLMFAICSKCGVRQKKAHFSLNFYPSKSFPFIFQDLSVLKERISDVTLTFSSI